MKPLEYINQYLYFVIRPFSEDEPGSLLYCSGVNVFRFLPITRGRHRPMSNPVMRSLQLVNVGVRELVLSRGATPLALRGNNCADIVPAGDGWYRDMLKISSAPASLPEEMIGYCVTNILKKTFKAICLAEDSLPDKLIPADELRTLIDSLCERYGQKRDKM